MARLQLEMQNLQAQLQSRTPATKDLSLVALVAKWGGTDKTFPLKEFFDIIEGTARIGNWSNKDMVRIAKLKLTHVARTFCNGTLELHDKSIRWTVFKAAFNDRFRDVRTDQYHFTQLQMPRQLRTIPPKILSIDVEAWRRRRYHGLRTKRCKKYTTSKRRECC